MTADPLVVLVIDGEIVPIKPFVQALIGRAVLGMVVNLKGVGNPMQVQLDIHVPSSEVRSARTSKGSSEQ
jgi:hypothetical protein